MKIEKEVHLRDYIRIIRKRRRTALAFFSIVMGIVIVATYTATPKYMASTKLLIEKVEPYTIVDYRYNTQDPEFYTTQYQLIRSRPVAEKVVASMLQDHEGAALLKKEFGWNTEPKEDRNVRVDTKWRKSVVRQISGNIQVAPVRATKIVRVMYVSGNPEFAAILVNKLAEAYIEALFEMRIHASGMTFQWIEEQVKGEREKLERSERVLQEYMRDNDIITLEDRLTILPQKLSELSIQLTRAEARRKELESLYERLKEIPLSLEGADSMPVVSGDVIVSGLKKQLIESERNADELSKKYGEKHPSMKEARNNVRLLRSKMNQEIKRVIASVKENYDLARHNESNLSSLLSDTKQQVLQINEKFVQYGVLKRDIDTNRMIFDSLLKRMGEQSINEQIQSVKVIHLEKADTPGGPYSPRKAMNLIAGFMLGTLGGLGCAFFVDYFDNTLKSPDEIEEKFDIPVIGMVSLLKQKGALEEGKRIETIVMDDPRSTLSESFKALRTAIMLSSAESPPKSLLITSMGPMEGKTSTSINLALAVSQFHKKVLLLDCDLRKPRIHKIFGIDNSRGISTYLAGESMDIITELTERGLSVVPSGPVPPDPSELLGSRRFDEFLSLMRERYDLIICDSPPVMSVSDALVLGSKLDGTIIVARAGMTTHDMLTKGLKAMRDINAHIVGLLINAVDIRKGDYYYYKYYNYNYSYAESQDEQKKDQQA
ncbi:GumC family protein [Nitrospirota bacterium]